MVCTSIESGFDLISSALPLAVLAAGAILPTTSECLEGSVPYSQGLGFGRL